MINKPANFDRNPRYSLEPKSIHVEYFPPIQLQNRYANLARLPRLDSLMHRIITSAVANNKSFLLDIEVCTGTKMKRVDAFYKLEPNQNMSRDEFEAGKNIISAEIEKFLREVGAVSEHNSVDLYYQKTDTK